MSESRITVRPAAIGDLSSLEAFVAEFVEANRLLPRTQAELKDLIPTGFVAVAGNDVVGFAALEIYSSKLAEVRSLAVASSLQGTGIGRRLVKECVDLARSQRILEVMAITSTEGFFQSCGFDFTLPGEKKALFIQTRDQVSE